MQSLIHGNFQGAAQKKTYALVGAAAAVGAAVGPLLGGFVTTYLSWRVGFLLEVVIIAIVLANIKLDRRRAVHRARAGSTSAVRCCPSSAWVASCSASSCGRRAAQYVGLLMVVGAIALGSPGGLARAAQACGQGDLLDPDLFTITNFRVGAVAMVLQQITLGGAMIALPLYLQVTLEYDAMQAGLSLAPLSLTMFAVALLIGKLGKDLRAASIIRAGFGLTLVGMALIDRGHPPRRVGVGAAGAAADRRHRHGPARVAAEQLHPRSDRRGAGQRGGRGELGRPVVRAVVRARRGRRHPARRAVVQLRPRRPKRARSSPPTSRR